MGQLVARRRSSPSLRLAFAATALLVATNVQSALAVLSDPVAIGGNTFTTSIWVCSGPGSQTVTASADAWVNQSSTGQNNGSDTVLSVRSASSGNRRTFVTFTLPTLPAACTMTSATLRLFDASPTVLRTIRAQRVAASWTENGITWSNQPGGTGAVATSSTPLLAGWQSWTVTAQVQAMYVGVNDGFVVSDQSENALVPASQQYSSREAGSNVPELIVSWS